MSEENNRKMPEGDRQEGAQGKGGHARHNRHRHHRGGSRPHGEKNPQAQEATASSQKSPDTEQKPANTQAKGEQGAQRHNQRQNANGKNEHRGKGNDRKKQHNGRPNRQDRERRPFDPYEKPSKEEISLSELRAQIVLKSADGTAPTPLTDTPKTTEPTPEQLSEAQKAAERILDGDTKPQASPATERVEVIGVRFRSSAKTYYFDPRGITAKKGCFVVVETTRGPEFGEVSLANTTVPTANAVMPLRPLLRIATPADVAHHKENRQRERDALKICQEKIAAHKLDMKLIDVQYAFDNSKLLFYFSSEGRVDFRELVKDLASVFRTRIELRQIGIRDEAKLLGGIGACGRTLCCSTFLPDFAQVSIKMAKEQNLSLNTAKISGVCGRLMCCLRYESEVYVEEIKKTPSNDTLVRTEDGIGVVIGSNPLAGTVRVLLKDAPDTPPKQYHRDSVTVLGKENRSEHGKQPNAQEKKGEKENKNA